jgi:hypothetical protein
LQSFHRVFCAAICAAPLVLASAWSRVRHCIWTNVGNGLEAVCVACSYPPTCSKIQLRISRLEVQLLLGAPLLMIDIWGQRVHSTLISM